MKTKLCLFILLLPLSFSFAQNLTCDFNGNDLLDIRDIIALISRLNHQSPFDTLQGYWRPGDCDCDSAHLTVADLFSLNNRLIFGESYGHGRRMNSSTDTLSMADMPGSPGQMISIPINLATSDSISGFQFYIRYDPLILQYIGLASVDSLGANETPYTIDGGVAQYYPLPHKMILHESVAWANFRVNPDLLPPLDTYVLFADNINHAIYSAIARVILDAVPPDSEITFIRPVRRTAHINIVEAGTESDTPDNYELDLSGYPNPFNSSVTIDYTIAAEGLVRLTIFDITGKKVAQISQGTQSAGQHLAVWNADGMSSGIYFVLFEAEDKTRSIMLILQK
jgi:hypothetical protein